MKIRRYIFREVFIAVGFVTLALLSLVGFFDLVDALRNVGRSSNSITSMQAVLSVAFGLPGRVYELLPITVLIGTIYVMARFAQTSEYTIFRTSGLGPGRALRILASVGALFVVLTFVIGDYIAPWSEHMSSAVKVRFDRELTQGRTGAWLRERTEDGSVVVNVGSVGAGGGASRVRIFTYDAKGEIASVTQAATGKIGAAGSGWELSDVRRKEFQPKTEGNPSVVTHNMAQWNWPTNITADMVTSALLDPDNMQTVDLFRYIQHLRDNGQSAQRYEIEFWRKVFYPLSCLVMVILALPFAYLHFRNKGIAAYVFGGVMAGISFFLLNNVFGYVGNLRDWSPWLAAATPGMLYLMLSLGALGWMIWRR